MGVMVVTLVMRGLQGVRKTIKQQGNDCGNEQCKAILRQQQVSRRKPWEAMREGSCGTVICVLQSTRNSVEKKQMGKSTLFFSRYSSTTNDCSLPSTSTFLAFLGPHLVSDSGTCSSPYYISSECLVHLSSSYAVAPMMHIDLICFLPPTLTQQGPGFFSLWEKANTCRHVGAAWQPRWQEMGFACSQCKCQVMPVACRA